MSMYGKDPEETAAVLDAHAEFGAADLMREMAARITTLETTLATARARLSAQPPTVHAGETAKHVTRAITALKTPPPEGSSHYQSGWDDGLEAALEATLAVLPERAYRVAALQEAAASQDEPWLSDAARIGRALIWSWTDIGKDEYGRGYRAAQAEARALLTGERGDTEARQGPAPDGKETSRG